MLRVETQMLRVLGATCAVCEGSLVSDETHEFRDNLREPSLSFSSMILHIQAQSRLLFYKNITNQCTHHNFFSLMSVKLHVVSPTHLELVT